MTKAQNREGIIKLGQTDGFRYVAIEPPLTQDQLEGIPKPQIGWGENKFDLDPCSISHRRGSSTELGFDSMAFHGGGESDQSQFIAYAMRIAEYLGGYSLDMEVRSIGPGPSIIDQANGAQPEW